MSPGPHDADGRRQRKPHGLRVPIALSRVWNTRTPRNLSTKIQRPCVSGVVFPEPRGGAVCGEADGDATCGGSASGFRWMRSPQRNDSTAYDSCRAMRRSVPSTDRTLPALTDGALHGATARGTDRLSPAAAPSAAGVFLILPARAGKTPPQSRPC